MKGKGGSSRKPWKEAKTVAASTVAERFWKRVVKGDGCWLWIGARTPSGYGQIDKRGAHRVSWELHNGPIPEGLVVRHQCDVPPCVRPDHLLIGTQKDNMADKVARGRHTHGTDVVTNKLTPQQIADMRDRYSAGEKQADLAKAFGVTQPHVSRLVRGDAWRHLPSGRASRLLMERAREKAEASSSERGRTFTHYVVLSRNGHDADVSFGADILKEAEDFAARRNGENAVYIRADVALAWAKETFFATTQNATLPKRMSPVRKKP